jgi:hypothetical protein
VQIDFGLVLDRVGEYWRLALGLRGVPGEGAVPVLDAQGNLIRAKSLRAGANVSLTEVEGLVTISSGVSQADVSALAGRVTILENTSQPMLQNGPLPPGEKVLTLLFPELARIERIQIGYGLLLERVEPAGYWSLAAQTIYGVLAENAVGMILNFEDFQRVKSLRAGAGVALEDADGVVTIQGPRPPAGAPSGSVDLIRDRVVRSLLAGANVSLTQGDDIVTISAAVSQDAVDDLGAGLTALSERLDDVVLTSQPMLQNGPLPPGDQVLTLLVPELGRIDRVEIDHGLLLERVDPA